MREFVGTVWPCYTAVFLDPLRIKMVLQIRLDQNGLSEENVWDTSPYIDSSSPKWIISLGDQVGSMVNLLN